MPHIVIIVDLLEKLNTIDVYSHAISENMGEYHGNQLENAQSAEANAENLADHIMDDYLTELNTVIEQQEDVLGI